MGRQVRTLRLPLVTEGKPSIGDLVEVTWIDIAGGESNIPECPEFVTPGYYVGWRTIGKEEVLHTARHRTAWPEHGWDAYPAGVVRKIEVVKKYG